MSIDHSSEKLKISYIQQDTQKALEKLLQETPLLWRGEPGCASAIPAGHSSGYPLLDALLPWKGWPRHGLIEIVSLPSDIGEISLLMPLMKSLTRQGQTCLWVNPPHTPYAPALLQAGITLEQVFVLRPSSGRQLLWALEKSLQTAACRLVLAWPGRLTMVALRRLQLATQTGETLGILFQQRHMQHSPAVLQLSVSRGPFPPRTLKVQILKARGTHLKPSTLIPLSSPEE
jgi:hypothetical protein